MNRTSLMYDASSSGWQPPAPCRQKRVKKWGSCIGEGAAAGGRRGGGRAGGRHSRAWK